MYVNRTIEKQIKKDLFKNKSLVIYGARQVGKTTLVKKLLNDYRHIPSRYINCDEADEEKALSRADTSTQLHEVIGNAKIVAIDEAQRVKNIGLKLKLLTDTFPKQQILATGSSSFELSEKVTEPMTGRAIEYWLYPFSLPELRQVWHGAELARRLENFLIYGMYPTVVEASSLMEKKTIVNTITTNYLYKDVLAYQNLRNTEIVRKLLEALALQIGNEVSYTELASLLEVNKETVAKYLHILEKAFIIFRLRPFTRNLRKELGKLRKVYFCDLGVRNALINNLNPLSIRNDIGALWENFIIAEKKKQEQYIGNLKRYFFWRTYDQQEIDLVEDEGGRLHGYEIKWQKARSKAPKAWRENYPDASWQVVTKDNYLSFLKPGSY